MAIQDAAAVDAVLLLEKIQENMNENWVKENFSKQLKVIESYIETHRLAVKAGYLVTEKLAKCTPRISEVKLDFHLSLNDGQLSSLPGQYRYTVTLGNYNQPKKTALAVIRAIEGANPNIADHLIKEITSDVKSIATAFVKGADLSDIVFKGVSIEMFERTSVIKALASRPRLSFDYSRNGNNSQAVVTERLRKVCPFWHEVLLEFIKKLGNSSEYRHLVKNSRPLMTQEQGDEFDFRFAEIFFNEIDISSGYRLERIPDYYEELAPVIRGNKFSKAVLRTKCRDRMIALNSQPGEFQIEHSLIKTKPVKSHYYKHLSTRDKRSLSSFSLSEKDCKRIRGVDMDLTGVFGANPETDTIYHSIGDPEQFQAYWSDPYSYTSGYTFFKVENDLATLIWKTDYQVRIVPVNFGSDESFDRWLEVLKSMIQINSDNQLDLDKFQSWAERTRPLIIKTDQDSISIQAFEFVD